MSTMLLSFKSKQFTSSVNSTCESLWIMLRRIFKVQISKDQDGKDMHREMEGKVVLVK